MSLAAVRPFFRNRMEILGYFEHEDAVDFDNIGSSVLDKAFQMETSAIIASPANQLIIDFDYQMTIRVFKRGFANPVKAYDEADEDIERILSDILSPAVKLNEEIKNITIQSINKLPLSVSDDNDLYIEFNFNVTLVACY